MTLLSPHSMQQATEALEWKENDMNPAPFHVNVSCVRADDTKFKETETASLADEYSDPEFIDVIDNVNYLDRSTGRRRPGEKTTRSGNGILVVMTNDIALAKSDPFVEMQRDALEFSRCKRSRRFEAAHIDTIQLRFSDLTIREYPYDIGDNPTPMSGPSLTIQWTHDTELSVSIDEYEDAIIDRRKGRQMLIPAKQRMEILRKGGYSIVQIRKETRPVNIARAQRQRTLATLDLANVFEVSEAITRKTVNILTLGAKKRREKAYLSKACGYYEKLDLCPVVPSLIPCQDSREENLDDETHCTYPLTI